MLGPGGVGGDVRQVDLGLLRAGQLDLGFLRRLFQALQGQRVLVQVDTGLFLELGRQVLDEAHVEVLTSQEGVTVGRQHLELVLAVHLGNLNDRDIEGTATQVVHRDGVVALGLVHAVGQRRRGGLVDNAFDVQPGDLAGVLGGLALGIVKIRRHGDNRLGHGLAEKFLRGFLHFAQYFSGDLRRCHFLAPHLYPGIAIVGLDDLVRDHLDVFLDHIVLEFTTDQALHRKQGIVRVGHRLALGALAHQDFAILGITDDGRRGAVTLRVLYHPGLAPLEYRYAGVGRAQVDSNNLAHLCVSG